MSHARAAAALSAALKEFHRALIRAEAGDDPALENPYTMLFALIGDPRFAWMSPLSGLIARIDQSIAGGEIDEGDAFATLRRETRALIGEGDQAADAAFRLNHLMALQKEPQVGLATGRLRGILREPPAG